jgi:transcriptional regulator with XRE-family HTH domain
VRAHRRLLRIDQRALAARAGVSKSTVARIERGDSRVALSMLRSVLAEVGLGVVLVDEDGYPWQDGHALPGDLEGAVDRADRRLPAHLPATLTGALRSWDFSRQRDAPVRAPARWRYDRYSDDVEAMVREMEEGAPGH